MFRSEIILLSCFGVREHFIIYNIENSCFSKQNFRMVVLHRFYESDEAIIIIFLKF